MSRLAARLGALDWVGASTQLDADGFATFERLLSAGECDAVAALYDNESRFRSRVAMARHGFGRGEYK